MSKVTLDKFLASLERSGLVAGDPLAQAVGDWQGHAPEIERDDPQCCADHLVDAGLLTRWQAKKLLDGRHRGFFLGKYRLLDHLGSGGMSSVYLARHVLMQRLVAIKVLPQNRVGDGSYLARFHLEGQCTAALDHPNIVRAYDLDSEGEIHYLVMEYIEGRDLDALVSHDGPLDFHVAADYVAQAAAGLQHAHDAGLVHRDIKPANLLVDLQGTVKILDMGLAKFSAAAASGALAGEEAVLGTADYVAPEQAVNSSAVDARADIYALGCTLYFLLCGHPPFASGSPLERMQAHGRQAPPSILLDRPDAPQPLVAICRRMMEKSPVNRHQTASEVRDALVAWLADEAAAGRTAARSDASMRHPSLTSRPRDSQAGSKINLISGSNSDLDRLVPPAWPAAPPVQVDPTAQQLGPGDAGQPGSPQWDVLRRELAPASVAAPHPLPPPIVDARGPLPAMLLGPPAGTPLGTPQSALEAVGMPAELPRVRATAVPLWPSSKSTAGIPWLWVIVLSGLILAAVLAALVAWPV